MLQSENPRTTKRPTTQSDLQVIIQYQGEELTVCFVILNTKYTVHTLLRQGYTNKLLEIRVTSQPLISQKRMLASIMLESELPSI
jgi:hypothetical protein